MSSPPPFYHCHCYFHCNWRYHHQHCHHIIITIIINIVITIIIAQLEERGHSLVPAEPGLASARPAYCQVRSHRLPHQPPTTSTPVFSCFRSVVAQLGLFFKQSTRVAPAATQSMDPVSSTSGDPVSALFSIDLQERMKKKVLPRNLCI